MTVRRLLGIRAETPGVGMLVGAGEPPPTRRSTGQARSALGRRLPRKRPNDVRGSDEPGGRPPSATRSQARVTSPPWPAKRPGDRSYTWTDYTGAPISCQQFVDRAMTTR